MKNRLWLHEELMKLVHVLGNDAERKADRKYEESSKDDDIEIQVDHVCLVKDLLPHAEIFDCRSLPLDFVLDTADNICEEPKDIRGPVRLPFSRCYFEYANKRGILCSIASFIEEYQNEEWVKVDVFAPPVRVDAFSNTDVSWHVVGTFANHIDQPLFEADPGQAEQARQLVPQACKLVLGTLGLLKEKFLLETPVSDPAPRLSKVRKQKGKYPISGPSRVLTVNVPVLKQVANQSTPAPHESPCLHWRRGHWRVLHRGSEFEDRTWVRKCLVGDPSKGFIRKSYRLVHELPMIISPNPQPPELIGS